MLGFLDLQLTSMATSRHRQVLCTFGPRLGAKDFFVVRNMDRRRQDVS